MPDQLDPSIYQLAYQRFAMADDPPPPSGADKQPFHLQGRPIAAPKISSFDTLKNLAAKTTQEGIQKQIESARPKTFEDLVKQRTKSMSREDLLTSDFMWAKARDLHYNRTQRLGFEPAISQAVKDMANYMLKLNGHEPLTDEETSKMVLGWLSTFKDTPFGMPP
jgi:hypothetical protein